MALLLLLLIMNVVMKIHQNQVVPVKVDELKRFDGLQSTSKFLSTVGTQKLCHVNFLTAARVNFLLKTIDSLLTLGTRTGKHHGIHLNLANVQCKSTRDIYLLTIRSLCLILVFKMPKIKLGAKTFISEDGETRAAQHTSRNCKTLEIFIL